MSNLEDEDETYRGSRTNEGDEGEDYNDYNDYDNERSSRGIEHSPNGSDGDESYDRRNRFRRHDSEMSEPDNSHQQTVSTENMEHSARKSGALQSSRNDPDPQYQHRDNRRGHYNNRYDNNRRNNNYQQNRGNRNFTNNNYNNQYNQPHQQYPPPATYPAYPAYPGAGYAYDPMTPQGGYYPPPMGYPPVWNAGTGYPYPPAAPNAHGSSGYFYGAEYGAQPGVAAGTSYGYGGTSQSINQSETGATTTETCGTTAINANEDKEGADQASEEPAGNTATSTTAVSGTSIVLPPSDGSAIVAATGYNLSGMGVYPVYPSPSHNFHQQPGPRHHRQAHMQLPRESNKANRPAVKNLPENERCTLRCTSIPVHITEEDLKAHFESFGHVVELQVSPMENQNGDDIEDGNEDSKKKKKACNECLVQFYSAGNARRCLTSEVPVLNNRFIFIYQSHFNIIPPQDVPRPSRDIIDRDAYLLQLKDIVPAASAAQAAASRKRTTLNMYATGMTNKWRRTDKEDATGPVTKVPGESVAQDAANEEDTEDKDAAETSSTGPVATQSAASKAAADEMKQSLLRQKQLKQQAEDLLKKKEDVLINQIEKCRTMMEKLEKAPDSDSKAKNLQYLEDKIVDLQSQLRDVREQVHQQQQQQAAMTAGLTGEKPSPSGKPPMGFFRGGYPGRFPGRGRGGGRVWMGSARGGGRFTGGRFAPRPSFTPQTSFNNPFAAKANASTPNASNDAEGNDAAYDYEGDNNQIQGGTEISQNFGQDGAFDDDGNEGN